MKVRQVGVAICALVALFLLCGCSGFEFASADSLMRPPKQTGENALIEAAFEENVGESYILTAPLNGIFRNSYIVYDINGDGLDEALVFYTTSSAGAVHINVIGRDGEKWVSVCDIEGAGTKIDRVEFADLDGDSVSEIIVGWGLYEGVSDQFMCVYRCSSLKPMAVSQISNIPYTSFECIDIDNNSVKDILLLSLSEDSDGEQRQYAKYVSLRDGKLSLVGEAALDPSVVSFVSVQTDVNPATSNCRIYIDAACEDGSWLTQCLVWNSENLVFDSPISDAMSGSVYTTHRHLMLLSRDIDGDGIIEMPSEINIKGSSVIEDNKVIDEKSIAAVVWLRILGFSTVEAKRCVYNQDDGYMLELLPGWDEVTAVSDRDNNTLKIYPYKNGEALSKSAKELFTIKTVSISQQSAYSAYYTELITDGGLCRMYKISSLGEKVGITPELLKKLITSI